MQSAIGFIAVERNHVCKCVSTFRACIEFKTEKKTNVRSNSFFHRIMHDIVIVTVTIDAIPDAFYVQINWMRKGTAIILSENCFGSRKRAIT